MHLPLVLPLISAFVYAFAAILLKRATERGIGPWRVSFVTNWTQAALFAPFWLAGGHDFSWAHFASAATCGVTFFLGQIFTFLALSRGDVSVATPVLGTKVLFVALFAVILGVEPLTRGMWLAVILTTVAAALLGGGGQRKHSFGMTLLFAFIAAAGFAMTDVLAQKWAPGWGFGHFAPAMFAVVALISFTLVPFFHGGLRELPWRWLAPGAVALAVQASGIAYSIIVFRAATTTNIIYNSRGVWTVLLVWSIGHWFDNEERAQGKAIMLRRLLGSALLLVAIVLIGR